MAGSRDYRAEYQRRIATAAARGLSRSQARGHARAGEKPPRGPPKALDDEKLQVALRALRQEQPFTIAAKAAGISPERLRRHASERGLIEKVGRRWQPKADLLRRVQLFSRGKAIVVEVRGKEPASAVGRYMAAVGAFLHSNAVELLKPFIGQSVRDAARKHHPFETNPNTLHRLAAGGERSFEEIYRIILN